MSLYQHEREGNAQELIGTLRRSENAEVRKRAASLLGNFEDHDEYDDVVRVLVQTAQEDDEAVVATAIDALDDLGQDAVETLIERMANLDLDDGAAEWVRAKAYMQALEAGVPELRMAAANVLGDLGLADSVSALAERFEDPDPRVRARAARACGQISDPRATKPLRSLLGDPQAGVRREAADALGAIGNREALQSLLGLYDDDHEMVRRIAVGGFGSFENDKPVEYLVDALDDESGAVRRTAVYSLIELLSNVPTDRSHEIRDSIVSELKASNDETVVEPLVEILNESTQPAQRRNTAWLLGRVVADDTDRAVADALIDALCDGEQMLQQFAATSLAQIGGTYVEKTLIEVLDDHRVDTNAKAQAVFTLGKVGGQPAKERLDSLLDETEDDQLRQKTFAALSKLGGAADLG
jgi:HEAT repeat protein